MLFKKYGIYGQAEYSALIGNKTIVFKGGASGTRGMVPASYVTSNPEEQQMIECSAKWQRGVIRLVEQWNEGVEEAKPVPAKEEAPSADTYADVTNMQSAIKVLSGKPYNVPLGAMQNKEATKKAATEKGVSFPNWK